MENYLIMDMDECMIHSMGADNEKHADKLIYDYGEHWRGEKFRIRHNGWYVSFKRSWTDELLTFARDLLGEDNVFIMSQGVLDYVLLVNKYLELGFNPNTNIFGRDDIARYENHPRFGNSFNVLVDNENYEYHNTDYKCKVKALHNIPREQLLQVEHFSVWTEPIVDQTEYLESIKARITKAFKL
jgi:hypothetical protein|tara:strand:- start:15540 stop:16094 length:555 start_codon:yes stop_codon:yes gene_type:complete